MNVSVTCKGTRPLLMSNPQAASPMNFWAKEMKKISGKRKKTDDDYKELARLGFESALYIDDEIGPYLPAANLLASIIEGAKINRLGKAVERGVVACDFMLPLIYKGPRTVEELWNDGESEFVDIRSVNVSRQKVDRCRPIFREWTVEAEYMVDPKIMDFETFRDICVLAGQMAGVGDYRKLYGRFEVEVKAK